MSETSILAIAAIVMSAASLGWQAVSWLRSGAVIRTSIGIIRPDTVTVTAYNSGRAAATITSVFVRDANSALLGWIDIECEPLSGSDSIPLLLPAGGHAQWNYKAIGMKVEWQYASLSSSANRYRLRADVIVGLKKYIETGVDIFYSLDGRVLLSWIAAG